MVRFTIVMLVLGLFQFGCTSMQRVDTTPQNLQAQIRAGKYLNEGQDVTVTTDQGTALWFRFQRLENDSVVGNTPLGQRASVPISDVVGLETDRVNVGRTAAAVGGGAAAAIAIAIGNDPVGEARIAVSQQARRGDPPAAVGAAHRVPGIGRALVL